MTFCRQNGLIIAIDGPSGAGKSTVTRKLADRLGYLHIDTGAMYRAVALLLKRADVSLEDSQAISGILQGIAISFQQMEGGYRVFVNGEDVSEAIRNPEISLLTSRVATLKSVRDCMLLQQREMGKSGGVVLEGRDIGTVVFPDAEIKFFLTASAEERGRRRFLELQAKGENVTVEKTIAAVEERDRQDTGREHAPLKRAKDAVDIDSTGKTIDEVITAMERMVRNRLAE